MANTGRVSPGAGPKLIDVIAALLPGVERSEIASDLRRFESARSSAMIEACKWRDVLGIVDRSQVEASLAASLGTYFALLSKADRLFPDADGEAHSGVVAGDVRDFFTWWALKGLARVQPALRMTDLNLSGDDLRRNHIPLWATPVSALGDVMADPS